MSNECEGIEESLRFAESIIMKRHVSKYGTSVEIINVMLGR